MIPPEEHTNLRMLLACSTKQSWSSVLHGIAVKFGLWMNAKLLRSRSSCDTMNSPIIDMYARDNMPMATDQTRDSGDTSETSPRCCRMPMK